MFKRIVIIAFTVLLSALSCASTPESISVATDSCTILIQPGSEFTNTGWIGPIPFTKGPQLAIWLADSTGKYLKTLYVSSKAAQGTWAGPPEGRPESLPVWLNLDKKNDTYDAVAAASASNENVHVAKLGGIEPGCQLFIEINQSYDWNEVWTKNARPGSPYFNGVNGQPSLIYHVSLQSLQGQVPFTAIGHGNPTGADGSISDDLKGISSALLMIKSAVVIFK